MLNRKKAFFYAGVAVWFFIVTAAILYSFFPYQKLIRVAFQSLLCSSKMVVSIQDARITAIGAKASRMVFGHEALKDKPLFEIEKVRISLNPLSLLEGVLNLHSDATAYGGSLKLDIDGIPALKNSTPTMKIAFSKIDFSKYPENRLPWFKGMTGIMNGWIKKEMPLNAPERQRGGFSINIQNGDIKEIQLKNGPRFNLPYRDITVEGRIDGDLIRLTKISINSMGSMISGTGSILTSDIEQKVDLKLFYDAPAQGVPFSGKGTIAITGNQWATEVNIVPGSPDKTETKK